MMSRDMDERVQAGSGELDPELVEFCAQVAKAAWANFPAPEETTAWDILHENHKVHYRRVARAVLEAARPTPSVCLSRLSIAQHALRRISTEANESSEARSLTEIAEVADGALAVIAMTAQPSAPEPPTAEVLAGLREEMQKLYQHPHSYSRCVALVETAQQRLAERGRSEG